MSETISRVILFHVSLYKAIQKMSIIHGIRTLGQPRCTWCRQNGIRDCTYGTAAREDIDTTLKRGMNLIRVEGIVDATVSWRCKNCFIYGN